MTDIREIASGLQFPEGPVWMPDGSIVLTARPPPNRFFEEENARPPEVRISGADANRNRIEGANDGCPVILNTPCFNRIPGRN